VKPNINSVKVHPKLSNNKHPVDGALVGAGSLRPDGAQSIFYVGIGDWLKANESNHTRFHPLTRSQSVYSSIHPSIHPTRIIRTLAMGTF